MKLFARLGTLGLLLAAWAARLHNVFLLATQADEGVHITAARLVAEDKLRIYADLFENRTPGVEWLLAGWFRLVGPDLFAARMLTLGVITITIALVYALGQLLARTFDGPAHVPTLTGLTAAGLLAFAPLHIHWSRFVMLEHYSSAAATAAVLLAIHAQRRSKPDEPASPSWIFAGLLTGLAVIFKQSEIVLVGALFVYFALLALTRPWGTALRAAGRWTLGLALTMGILFTALALQDAIEPFLKFTFSAGQIAPFQNLEAKGMELLSWTARRPTPWLILLALPFLVRSGRTVQGNGATSLLLLWFAAEAAFMLLPPVLDFSPGGFSHYLIPVLVPASVLAASGVFAAWGALRRRPTQRRYAIAASALLLLLFITPAWMDDLWAAISDRSYPQATRDEEKRIAHAAALLSSPDESIQVLANAAFYYGAQRRPASRFFHWPDYLAQSSLAESAATSVVTSLQEAQSPVVLVSRLHLQERLPDQVQGALWQNYTPVALFPYAYQRDVIAFMPAGQEVSNGSPLARFGQVAELSAVGVRWLDAQNLLVSLSWQALSSPQNDFTAFVHVLDQRGALLAQDDAQPVVGFRPTSTWRDGEAVLDYHWITLPEGTTVQDGSLSIGLYESSTGERLLTNENGAQSDAYTQPLEAAP